MNDDCIIDDHSVQESVRCPTCRAIQEWSDACRRCRADLRLLRAVVDEYWDRRRRCLIDLRAGQTQSALAHARACAELRPDDEARRLLAVCALLHGDWPAALAAARIPLAPRPLLETG